MMIKNRISIALLSMLVVAAGLWGDRTENPEKRRPLNVGGVEMLTKPFQLKKKFLHAKTSAENMDRHLEQWSQARFMSGWARWRQGINLSRIQAQHSRDLESHLQAMTRLMRFRRENGGRLQKFQEFDFQNLVRKSDFLLNHPLTTSALKESGKNPQRLNLITAYNQERRSFDAQMISIAQVPSSL